MLRLTGNIADVEELINDVMWVVWEKAAQFRGDSQVKTWVLGIATLKSYRWRHLQPPRSNAVDDLELHVDVEMAEEESVASTIAIIDTGVDRQHPNLRSRIAFSDNFVGDDTFDSDMHCSQATCVDYCSAARGR